MVFRFFKTAHQKVADFCHGRSRQADEAFLAECGLPDSPEARRVALAVRRAVGNVGLVDSQFVRVDDDWPGSLVLLPLWDSMDCLAFLPELEEELGEEPRSIEEACLDLFAGHFTVKEMAAAVYAAIAERQSQKG